MTHPKIHPKRLNNRPKKVPKIDPKRDGSNGPKNRPKIKIHGHIHIDMQHESGGCGLSWGIGDKNQSMDSDLETTSKSTCPHPWPGHPYPHGNFKPNQMFSVAALGVEAKIALLGRRIVPTWSQHGRRVPKTETSKWQRSHVSSHVLVHYDIYIDTHFEMQTPTQICVGVGEYKMEKDMDSDPK